MCWMGVCACVGRVSSIGGTGGKLPPQTLQLPPPNFSVIVNLKIITQFFTMW